MSIAALGFTVAYLLIVAAGATAALLVLVWLFREAPGTARRTGRETSKGLRNSDRFRAESTSSASVEPERPEDKAA